MKTRKAFLTLLSLLFAVPVLASAQQQITQSEGTAARRRIPVVLKDVADHLTPKTGVTISGAECKLSKNGGSESNCSGTVTEVAGGIYYFEAASGEVDTLGYSTVRIVDSAADPFFGWYQVVGTAAGIAQTAFQGQLASASGTTVGLASGGVTADNQFVPGTSIAVYNSSGTLLGRSCIIASANTGDTVTTREDIDAQIAANDYYNLITDAGCAAVRPTTAERTLDVAATGEAGIDLDNTTGTLQAAEFATNAFTAAKFATDFFAKFFSQDSGTTYASAVDGSVVKEIAANAAGSGGGGTSSDGAFVSPGILTVFSGNIASAVTGQGQTAVTPDENFIGGVAWINGDYVSGTTATLNVIIQDSPDGTNWKDLVTFTQVTTSDATEVKTISRPIMRKVRAKITTTSGSTPNYNVTVEIWGRIRNQ